MSNWYLYRALHPYVLEFLVWKGTLHATKIEMYASNQLQTLLLTMLSCLQDMLGQW